MPRLNLANTIEQSPVIIPDTVTIGITVLDNNGEVIADHQRWAPTPKGQQLPPEAPPASINSEKPTFEILSFAKLAIGHIAVKHGVQPPYRSIPQPASLETAVSLRPANRRPGFGITHLLPDGYTMPLRDWLEHMLFNSDNTAMQVVASTIAGTKDGQPVAQAVNGLISQDEQLGQLAGVGLRPHSQDPSRFWCDSHITSETAAKLFYAANQLEPIHTALQHGAHHYGLRRNIEELPQPAPLAHTALLTAARTVHRLGGHLPRLAYKQLTAHRPSLTAYPNKMGIDGDEGMFHDIASSSNYTVAVLSEGWCQAPETPDHPAHALQAYIGEAVLGQHHAS